MTTARAETAMPPPLAYVALAVDDPERSAAFFEVGLGLRIERRKVGGAAVPFVGVGDTALGLFDVEHPFLEGASGKGVHHIAIASDDPEARTLSVFGTQATPSDGIDGRTQVQLARELTCGVQVRLTQPLTLAGGCSETVERIDHIGVASGDNQAAKHAFIENLGCVYESQQTDSELETLSENFVSDVHGNVFHTRPTTLRGSLRVTFISVGDCELEFLQDLTMSVKADAGRHDIAGNTRGDRSAIARFVERRGQGLHHLALKTPDINAALARLHAAGFRIIDNQGRPGSRRAQIGFIHPSAVGGVLIHFVQRELVQ